MARMTDGPCVYENKCIPILVIQVLALIHLLLCGAEDFLYLLVLLPWVLLHDQHTRYFTSWKYHCTMLDILQQH
jgi:hypothetical protein